MERRLSTENHDSQGEGATSPDEREAVEGELQGLKAFAQTLSLDDLKGGSWFAKLLTFSLARYVEKVDAHYFRTKYPHLPPDAVADARIQLASRYAGIEGGLSASAYTGAVAATMGSGGGASPVTVPGGVASFAVDLLFVTQVQLRLAYDIAVLYGVPLDLDDPEDVWKLIRVAFAVKSGEMGRGAASKGAPAILRPVLKKVFSGSTLATAKSLPVVGKYLLQRNIIKFAIPVVSVPISTGVNYWSTRIAGRHAQRIFRHDAQILEVARRVTSRTHLHDELVWVLWLISTVDGPARDDERRLVHEVTSILYKLEKDIPALEELREVVDLEPSVVWAKVNAARGDRAGLYDAAVLAAVIDGEVSAGELTALRDLADLCASEFDAGAIRQEARRNRW
ncbi:EcsC family protein [Phycicoccus jejuensis]|uniref:hypothetical protein n=1 Tax=Phycicoccus jejuensis TaxID=367299 RepID=UPI00384BF8D9